MIIPNEGNDQIDEERGGGEERLRDEQYLRAGNRTLLIQQLTILTKHVATHSSTSEPKIRTYFFAQTRNSLRTSRK